MEKLIKKLSTNNNKMCPKAEYELKFDVILLESFHLHQVIVIETNNNGNFFIAFCP